MTTTTKGKKIDNENYSGLEQGNGQKIPMDIKGTTDKCRYTLELCALKVSALRLNLLDYGETNDKSVKKKQTVTGIFALSFLVFTKVSCILI